MVSGFAVRTMTPVIDTRSISKIKESGKSRRISFFRRSTSNASTASTASSRSGNKATYYTPSGRTVRFARKQDIKHLPSMSAEDKSNMHYSKPELQAIAGEMIKTCIMCSQGVNLAQQNRCVRGLESTQSQLGDRKLTESRAKYIKSVVAEYRFLKRSRMSKNDLHEKLRDFSCEQTDANRQEGVQLGKVDASAAGVTVYSPSVKSTKFAVSPRPSQSYHQKSKPALEIEAVLSDDEGLAC